MNIEVDAKHPFVNETETHTFSCFASDVDVFRKGWPSVVTTNIGNGMPFVGFKKKLNADGDIEYVRYRQQLGCVDLVVYND